LEHLETRAHRVPLARQEDRVTEDSEVSRVMEDSLEHRARPGCLAPWDREGELEKMEQLELLASLVTEDRRVVRVIPVREVQTDSLDSRENREVPVYRVSPDSLDRVEGLETPARPVYRAWLVWPELLDLKDCEDSLDNQVGSGSCFPHVHSSV